jgi:hypothetical protein
MFMSLFWTEVSRAGLFDPALQTLGDIISGGGNPRQRDWEACIRDRDKRIQTLMGHLAEIDRQLAADLVLLTMNSMSGQQGAITQIIKTLKELKDQKQQDTLNMESWHSVLAELLPSLPNESQFAGKILLKQLELAKDTDDARVIENLISVLDRPSDSTFDQLNGAWTEFMSRRTARSNELAALIFQLNESIRSKGEENSRLNNEKKNVAEDLNLTRNRC